LASLLLVMHRRWMPRKLAVLTLLALLAVGAAFSEEILTENDGVPPTSTSAVVASDPSAFCNECIL
jgi:hypothetical protein